MSNLIGVKEAAELLGVSTKTIRRWEEEGKIRSIRTPKENLDKVGQAPLL